jgi:uncharacterized SAM-binding protein YcdF (DUF218 family)
MDAPCVDALLVLGGEDRQDWPRCAAALHYYRDCRRRGLPPPRLILSGGKIVRHDNQWFTESALMVRFFLAQGIPASDLLVEPHATDTFGNVVWGGALAALHGLTRVALVTDDFHHWRSRRIFRRVFGLAPGEMVHTGIKGSWRARIRERLAYWALRIALQAAGVPKGSLDAHKLFLQRRHKESGPSDLRPDCKGSQVLRQQGPSGEKQGRRRPDVAAHGVSP